MDKKSLCYAILVFLRFILTFLPQTGYIHPDEFFQFPEVVYGDIFGFQTLQTWEFKSLKPIRSILFPYFIVGIPACIMNYLGVMKLFGTSLFPYLLLILPRIFMCTLSLIHDICLYKICTLTKKNPMPCLILLASSYVTLIYFTRTLGNSVEAICFTLVLYFVVKEKKCKSAPNCNNVTFSKDANKNYSDSYFLGILFAVGCFVRPTFLCLAGVPAIFWLMLLAQATNKLVKVKQLSLCISGMLISSWFLVWFDTAYYTDNYDIVLKPAVSIAMLKNFILTPLNFITYNLDNKNLVSHGSHPRYLHFLVNIPLTFSILGLLGLFYFLKLLICLLKRKTINLTDTDLLMLLSFIFPMVLLSIVPHQEPRFIIPVLFPLVYLCGNTLFTYFKRYKLLVFVWITTNLLGVIFFGFAHQGGIFSVLSFLHTRTAKSNTGNTDIVFYHTYMPPRHLIALPRTLTNVNVHDLAGSLDHVLLSTVQDILKNYDSADNLFIVIPSSKIISMVNINIVLSPDYEVQLQKTFFPHLGMEDAPVIHNAWTILTSQASTYYKIYKLRDLFSLNVYKIGVIKT